MVIIQRRARKTHFAGDGMTAARDRAAQRSRGPGEEGVILDYRAIDPVDANRMAGYYRVGDGHKTIRNVDRRAGREARARHSGVDDVRVARRAQIQARAKVRRVSGEQAVDHPRHVAGMDQAAACPGQIVDETRVRHDDRPLEARPAAGPGDGVRLVVLKQRAGEGDWHRRAVGIQTAAATRAGRGVADELSHRHNRRPLDPRAAASAAVGIDGPVALEDPAREGDEQRPVVGIQAAAAQHAGGGIADHGDVGQGDAANGENPPAVAIGARGVADESGPAQGRRAHESRAARVARRGDVAFKRAACDQDRRGAARIEPATALRTRGGIADKSRGGQQPARVDLNAAAAKARRVADELGVGQDGLPKADIRAPAAASCGIDDEGRAYCRQSLLGIDAAAANIRHGARAVALEERPLDGGVSEAHVCAAANPERRIADELRTRQRERVLRHQPAPPATGGQASVVLEHAADHDRGGIDPRAARGTRGRAAQNVGIRKHQAVVGVDRAPSPAPRVALLQGNVGDGQRLGGVENPAGPIAADPRAGRAAGIDRHALRHRDLAAGQRDDLPGQARVEGHQAVCRRAANGRAQTPAPAVIRVGDQRGPAGAHQRRDAGRERPGRVGGGDHRQVAARGGIGVGGGRTAARVPVAKRPRVADVGAAADRRGESGWVAQGRWAVAGCAQARDGDVIHRHGQRQSLGAQAVRPGDGRRVDPDAGVGVAHHRPAAGVAIAEIPLVGHVGARADAGREVGRVARNRPTRRSGGEVAQSDLRRRRQGFVVADVIPAQQRARIAVGVQRDSGVDPAVDGGAAGSEPVVVAHQRLELGRAN